MLTGNVVTLDRVELIDNLFSHARKYCCIITAGDARSLQCRVAGGIFTMTVKLAGFLASWLLAIFTTGLLLTGCESSTTNTNITINPSSETRSAGDDVHVLLTAAGSTNLYLPLKWSVSNSELGHIQESAGYSAVYESYGLAGNNVIEVKDQGTAEGVAVVYWR
jgi:hypothetical protein